MAKKRIVKPTDKYNPKLRRDVGRFAFFKEGGKWFARPLVKGGRKHEVEKPPATYQTPGGEWRKLNRKTGKTSKAKTPRVAQKISKPSTRFDTQALKAFREHLNNEGSSLWDFERLPAVRATGNRSNVGVGKGSRDGWRLVARFRSSNPPLTTLPDLDRSMESIEDDLIIQKAWGDRKFTFHLLIGTEGEWNWVTPVRSLNFGTEMEKYAQWSAEMHRRYKERLAANESDDDEETVDHVVVKQIHVKVE